MNKFYKDFKNGYGPCIIGLVGLSLLYKFAQHLKSEEFISIEDAILKLKNHEISKIVTICDSSTGNPTEINVYNSANMKIGAVAGTDFIPLLKEIDISEQAEDSSAPKVQIEYSSYYRFNNFAAFILINFIILLPILAPRFPKFFRKLFGEDLSQYNQMFRSMGVGKSKAVEYNKTNKVDTKFKDVAGMEGPKEEIKEVVEFLKSPEKFRKLGAKIPKGVLLVGPPGTGKTLLAKACAGEAGVSYFVSSGSEFVEMYVGVGASRVRNLFQKAREKAPAIIFIDEIDAVGKRRSRMFGNEERESTLNQMFVEMDGFGTTTNVVVLAATNRKETLDPALIRPGRFDRLVEVTLPNLKEREDIFIVHLSKIVTGYTHSKEEIAKKLSALTTGMSGAEIMSICNEAALIAARNDKKQVELTDFYEAYDRVLTGLKRNLTINEFNKRLIAFHEAGHTAVAWFLKNAQQVLKVTVVPRSKGSFGHTELMPNETHLYTKDQLYDMLKVAYGGRATEEIFMRTMSTGASDDISKATELAKQIGRAHV